MVDVKRANNLARGRDRKAELRSQQAEKRAGVATPGERRRAREL